MAPRQKVVETEPASPAKKRTAKASSLWIGEHSADGDILVLDAENASQDSGRISYYSLTQFRWRVFPAAIAESKIREVTDEIRVARARKEYARRAELEAEHEETLAEARADVAERQREQVIRLHENYMQAHGIPHEGVRETPSDHKSRRSRCHACGIALDDFVARTCIKCNEVLCSCGACGCGRNQTR